MPSLEKLKRRKLVQWTLTYLAGAWVVLQLVDVLSEPWDVSSEFLLTTQIVLVFGLFVTLVLAWYHGERGQQWVSGPELLLLAGMLVLGGLAISLVRIDPAESADSFGTDFHLSSAPGLDSVSSHSTAGLPLDQPELQPHRAPTAAEIMRSRQVYLRAEAEWENAMSRPSAERLVAAVPMFDSAVALDPSNAKAWAALARSYTYLGVYRILPADSVFPLVKEPAARAIELDSTLALSHEALAMKYWVFDWEWIKAHDEFVRAAQLEPDTPKSYERLAEASHILTDLGWGDSAVAIVRPVIEQHWLAALNYLTALLNNGRLEEALSEAYKLDSVELLTAITESAPEMRGIRWKFGEIRVHALLGLGRPRDAEEELLGMDSLVADNRFLSGSQRMLEAYVQVRSGNTTPAEAMLAEAAESGLSLVNQAILYAWLDDSDRAFDLLEAEFDAKGFVYWFPSRPDLAPLRTDPRFAILLSQMGLSCRYGIEGHECYQL